MMKLLALKRAKTLCLLLLLLTLAPAALHVAAQISNQPSTARDTAQASQADLRAYGRLQQRQINLIGQWAADYNLAHQTNLHPASIYGALTRSQHTTYEAVTHALINSRLTDQQGKPLRQNALALVTAIKEIAGEVKGARGDRQFRLYVTLAPDAERVLAQSREFFRDKENTVFHKGYPTNFRQRGHTPTLQFSISEDGSQADIDVDYRSSHIPQALIDGHLRAANSDVRAGGNYTGHVSRWFGLISWWRSLSWGKAKEKDQAAPLPAARPAVGSSDSSADELGTKLTPAQAAEARAVAETTHKFLTAWLLERDHKRAQKFLIKHPVACVNLDRDAEHEVTAGPHAIGTFALLLEAHQQKRHALAEAVIGIDAWHPELIFAEHPHTQLFHVQGMHKEAAARFMCDTARVASDAQAYGHFYATTFTLKTGPDSESALLLLWTKEDGEWRIISYDLLKS